MERIRLIGLWLGATILLSATINDSVTYYRDVLPVLQNHCQSCHRPGHVAPIPFMTYKETRPWAEAMKDVVISRQMPPWFTERPYVPAAADPGRLTPLEIETIVRWVELGAPAGDPKDAPPPLYLQQAHFGNPLGPGSVKPIAWR